jgi:hypothetical protein
MPNIRLGVAITFSANGKQPHDSAFTADRANEMVLDHMAPALAELLAAEFPDNALVPAEVNVSHLSGDYSVSMGPLYKFTATMALGASTRAVSLTSPLGVFDLGFIRQSASADLTMFRLSLPSARGCQDGTVNLKVSPHDQSVHLTIPYTYSGMEGCKGPCTAVPTEAPTPAPTPSRWLPGLPNGMSTAAALYIAGGSLAVVAAGVMICRKMSSSGRHKTDRSELTQALNSNH